LFQDSLTYTMKFFTLTLLVYVITASCPDFVLLPDGREVPMPGDTAEGEVAKPICRRYEGLELLPGLQGLRCTNGVYYAEEVGGGCDHDQCEAQLMHFCSKKRFVGHEERAQMDRDALKRFWLQFEDNEVSTSRACQGNEDCKLIPEFAQTYKLNTPDVVLTTFLGLELTKPAELYHDVAIDRRMRELEYGNGQQGYITEYDDYLFNEGQGVAFVSLTGVSNSFAGEYRIVIAPCLGDEDCSYVIYQLFEGEGEVGEVEMPDVRDSTQIHDEKVEVLSQKEETINNRFAKLGEERRRRMQALQWVSMTFMHDPQSFSSHNAQVWADWIIIKFNHALAQGGATFRLYEQKVASVPHGTFQTMGITPCAAGANPGLTTCSNQAAALHVTARADLYHCFIPGHRYGGSVVGCATFGGVGTTSIDYMVHHDAEVVLHEIGHQMHADHKSECWDVNCRRKFFPWWEYDCDRACSLMNPYAGHYVNRFHADSINQMNAQANIANNVAEWCAVSSVTMHTRRWGNEISWRIENSGCSGGAIRDHTSQTYDCCLPEGNFQVVCMDTWGDGWHGGYLEIDGRNYCQSFGTGHEKRETLVAGTHMAVELSGNGAHAVTNVGEATFNAWFSQCPVVQYSRNGVVHSVYKRTSPIPAGFNAYAIFTHTWRNHNNNLGTDFQIYDNINDLRNNQGAWTFCNYNDPDVGYPRDCGKHGHVIWQWFSMPGWRFNAPHLSSGASFQIFTAQNCPV